MAKMINYNQRELWAKIMERRSQGKTDNILKSDLQRAVFYQQNHMRNIELGHRR